MRIWTACGRTSTFWSSRSPSTKPPPPRRPCRETLLFRLREERIALLLCPHPAGPPPPAPLRSGNPQSGAAAAPREPDQAVSLERVKKASAAGLMGGVFFLKIVIVVFKQQRGDRRAAPETAFPSRENAASLGAIPQRARRRGAAEHGGPHPAWSQTAAGGGVAAAGVPARALPSVRAVDDCPDAEAPEAPPSQPEPNPRGMGCPLPSDVWFGTGARRSPPRRRHGSHGTGGSSSRESRTAASPPRGQNGFGAPGCGFQKATPDFGVPRLPLLRVLCGSLLLAPRVPKVTVSGSSHFCHSLGVLVPNLTKYLY